MYSSEMKHTILSENKTQRYRGYGVNFSITNDLSTAGKAATVAMGVRNERVGGSWKDYSITCSNIWGETLYTINLTITDQNMENTDPGGSDEYPDWN